MDSLPEPKPVKKKTVTDYLIYAGIAAIGLAVLFYLIVVLPALVFPHTYADTPTNTWTEQAKESKQAKEDIYFSRKNRKDRKPTYTAKKPKITLPDFFNRIVVYQPVNTDWEKKLKEFTNKTGFKGEIIRSKPNQELGTRKYAFEELIGQFPLPIPSDTLHFRLNADIIIKNILNIYEQSGERYVLKPLRISANEYVKSEDLNQHTYITWYYQAYGKQSILCGNTNNSAMMTITYNKNSNKYHIKNNLFEQPLIIPTNIVDRDNAIRMAKYLYENQYHLNASIPSPQPMFVNRIIRISFPDPDNQYYYYIHCAWYVTYHKPVQRTIIIDAFTGKVKYQRII